MAGVDDSDDENSELSAHDDVTMSETKGSGASQVGLLHHVDFMQYFH